MPVYSRGKGYDSVPGERGHRRHARTAGDTLSSAEDEEAVIVKVEVAMVCFLGLRFGCDVVVEEGYRAALGRAGLWRQHVEVDI